MKSCAKRCWRRWSKAARQRVSKLAKVVVRAATFLFIAVCSELEGSVKILVIDTCGEVGSVALGEGTAISETLQARGASSALLPAVGRLLKAKGWALGDLDEIGVVNGPGSFTGMRVGLAAAKGLSEAAGLRLVGISRLAVLADVAGLVDGCAVLDGGRGEFYVRVVGAGKLAREVLLNLDDLRGGGGGLVIAEERLSETLAEFRPEWFGVGAEQALPLMLREGGGDAALVDANYVRGEGDIYGKTTARGEPT